MFEDTEHEFELDLMQPRDSDEEFEKKGSAERRLSRRHLTLGKVRYLGRWWRQCCQVWSYDFCFKVLNFAFFSLDFFVFTRFILNFDLFYSRFISQLKILAKIYRINTIIWSNNITWLTFARFRLLLQIDPTCQNKKKNRPLPRIPHHPISTHPIVHCSCTPKSKSTASRRPPPCTWPKGKAPWRRLLTRPKVPQRQGPYATARRRHSADVTRNKRPPDPRTTGPEPFPNQFHAILILWVLFFCF